MYISITKKVVKEVEEVTDSYYQCDKCETRIKKEHSADAFDMDFEINTGTAWNSGQGSGDRWKMELCEKCAIDLKDELITKGYKIRHNEWSL